MEKSKVFVQNWPGGISTFAGGTRTAIKLNRPWQTRLNIDPMTCPFEPFKLEADKRPILERSADSRWVSFENRFTPNLNHILVVPVTCEDWPDARVRLLGGKEEIDTALGLVHKTIALRPIQEITYITINIGWAGGQNVGHIHWHAFSLPSEAVSGQTRLIAQSLEQINNPALILFNQSGLQVVVGGHRAGQCFIIRKVGCAFVNDIAAVITRLVTLYAYKFQSGVGEKKLAPDFTIGLIYDKGNFVYGTYVPVLNNWGSTEYLALLGQQAVTLPWPHEMTAAYLRGEIKL